MTAVSGFEEAQALLEQTRRGRTLANDVLPEADLYSFGQMKPWDLLDQFGANYRKFLQHSLITEKIRNACNLAEESLGRGLHYPSTASLLTCFRMGSNRPDELALDVWINAFLEGTPAYRVYAESDDPTRYNHVFVIYGATNDELQTLEAELGDDLFLLMSRLTSGYVIDPYLNSVCSVKDFANSKTGKFCKENKINGYLKSVSHPPTKDIEAAKELVAELHAESDQIRAVARTLLNNPKNTNQRIEDLQRVVQVLKRAPDSKTVL